MSLPPELVRRYIAHLETLRQDVATLQPIVTTTTDGEAREKLRRLCHQLAGTAEAYGFPVVGTRAREVEAALVEGTSALADQVSALAEALAKAVGGAD